MALRYAAFRRALEAAPLPAFVVDRDAFDRNVERVASRVRRAGRTMRIASKSVRVPALLRRILDRAGPVAQGVLCYSAREAAFLASLGFDDLLVAYPAWQAADLDAAAATVARGVRLRMAVDSEESLVRLGVFGTKHGVVMPAVLCVDMSLAALGGRVHLGVRRSPLHAPAQVAELVGRAQALGGVEITGILAYEAQIAGLADAAPGRRVYNAALRAFKELSLRELVARRGAIVAAARRQGAALELVNGGGTGSLDETLEDPAVTEVTVGSAFYKPHLFDAYRSPAVGELEPAAFFALEVTRVPAAGYVTCAFGGYAASGPGGADRVPRPWLPEGLELLPDEAAGEVQTPLRLPAGTGAAAALERGDPVLFRHAKAGEIAERFPKVWLVSGDAVVAEEPTYRGLGHSFG